MWGKSKLRWTAGSFFGLLLTGLTAIGGEPTDEQVLQSFTKASGGFSSDELLLQDQLRERFLNALSEASGEPRSVDGERTALLKLLKLRKAGKLKPKATRRGTPTDSGVAPIAEIASRVVTDRHRVTSDTVLADPNLRDELQKEAEKILPGVDPYSIRKAVLQLRKKRALRPELVLQVADWQRDVQTYSLNETRRLVEMGRIAPLPGVYLFRNAEGYLYIGEAGNLASRLKEHLAGSDRKSLADYLASEAGKSVSVELHLFPADSPASKVTVRRAYESELIRSRNPKFNVRP